MLSHARANKLILASIIADLPKLVYNTSSYDSPEALALLDGPVEIYMPDMEYGDANCSA